MALLTDPGWGRKPVGVVWEPGHSADGVGRGGQSGWNRELARGALARRLIHQLPIRLFHEIFCERH